MLYYEPEQVVVPLVNQGPDVSSVEVLGAVEQRARWLNRDRGDGVLGGEMGDHIGEGAVKGALSVKGALELQEWTVSFVRAFFRQSEGFAAAHGMVAAGVPKELRDLLDGEVPLVAHGAPACRAVRQPREAVVADQVPLDALLYRRRDVIQAHGALKEGKHGNVLDLAEVEAVGLEKIVHFRTVSKPVKIITEFERWFLVLLQR